MKKAILAIIMLCVIQNSFTQSTSINYQAQVRDDTGHLITNREVTLRFYILQGILRINVYQEIHETNTNEEGLVTLQIGEGLVESGDYNSIDWGVDDHFLNVQINAGDGFIDLGTSEFNAVPYALTSLNSVQQLDDLNDAITSGSSLYIGDSAGSNVSQIITTTNTGVGYRVLSKSTTGSKNVALGSGSLSENIIGNRNTAVGHEALFSNVDGHGNVAVGSNVMSTSTIASYNVALGSEAFENATTGMNNVAIGHKAMETSTTASSNLAIGALALSNNTTGDFNNSLGGQSLLNNTSGQNNNALGYATLYSNTIGHSNIALGLNALYFNTNGDNNIAIGSSSLVNNTVNNDNVAIGMAALNSKTTGDQNVALGRQALSTLSLGSNNIGIGYNAQVPSIVGHNQIRMGNTSIQSASIQVAWNVTSDKRWKEAIRELPYGLDFVKQLQPVDYVRKNNDAKTRETGFIAQDVEALLQKVGYTDQGLLTKDDEGRLSLRYNDFIAILVKALQDQQNIISQQGTTIDALAQRLDALEDANKTQMEASN